MKESFLKIYLEGICVADILIKQNLGDRQIIETCQLKHQNVTVYILVLTKALHLGKI